MANLDRRPSAKTPSPHGEASKVSASEIRSSNRGLRIFSPDQTGESIRACPSCEFDNRSRPNLELGRDHWRLKRCHRCEFVYLENALGYQELADSKYAWTKTHASEESNRRRAEPVIHRISTFWKEWRRRHLPRDKALDLVRKYVPAGRVLDIGCSYGMLLQRIPANLTPFGVEIEAAIADVANEVVKARGGRVVNSDAIQGLLEFDDQFFDGVAMVSFLEHEIQPRELLAQVRRVLRDEGKVFIKVPNFGSWNRRMRGRRWCGLRFPDHVNYFTPRSLTDMVERCGYQVVRCSGLDRFPLSDSLWMVAAARD